MEKTFFTADITAILDSRITPSNSVQVENLEKIGTTKELLTFLGCTRCSKVRLNKKDNPYFMIWGTNGTFYLPLSKNLRKFDWTSISELLDYPVYVGEGTLEETGEIIKTVSIGIEQRDDVEDFDFAPTKPVAKPQPKVKVK
jgi:hypothetical protein